MRNSAILLSLAACAAIAFAQPQLPGAAQTLAHRIDIPHDSPVTLAGDEWGGSAATVRGGAYTIDVKLALSLRNSSQRRVRGITLTVLAQEATPGGKGSISVPSLDVAPGETFTVRGDLHLLRPIGAETSPLVEVSVDGVLFDDLTFYGPNKLLSRRSMMVWELEARRDRQYFRALLDQSGREGLQKAMLASLTRDSDRPQFGVQMVRGRSTNADADKNQIADIARDVAAIAGQKPVLNRSKKAIANFKLKQNQIVGCSVTLRGDNMWEFLQRLLAVALPTIRDFRGVPSKFDGQGNYNLGVADHTIFPEITVENVKKHMGLDITIVTTAQTDDEGRELLRLLGMPFRRSEAAAPKPNAS